MVKYSLYLKLKGSTEPKEGYPYSLDLTSAQEDNPEKLFNSEIRERMRTSLQKQSSSKINDNHLNQIVKTWISDIIVGARSTTLTLDLPSLLAASIQSLKETGNQELPLLPKPDLSNVEPTWGMLPSLVFS